MTPDVVIPAILFILFAFFVVFIMPRGDVERMKRLARLAESGGYPPAPSSEWAARLALFFGVANRPESYRPDPCEEAQQIVGFLRQFAGPDAHHLIMVAMHHFCCGRLPEAVNDVREYDIISRAIEEVMKQYAYDYDLANSAG